MKRNRGKLFGAALGFSFGGPIGALLGAAIGHLVDETSDSTAGPGASVGAGRGELNFITSLIYLLVGAAQADGAVTDREIETIKNFFKNQLGYSSTQLYFVNRIITAALGQNINMGDACRDISSRTCYEERLFLIRLCYEVALSDRNINPLEEEFIARAAQNLGINDYDYMMVRRSFVDSQGADLGEPQAVHRRFRRPIVSLPVNIIPTKSPTWVMSSSTLQRESLPPFRQPTSGSKRSVERPEKLIRLINGYRNVKLGLECKSNSET
jgi:DnaJ like chaperone protein